MHGRSVAALVTAGPGFLDPFRHETSQRGSAVSLQLAGQLMHKWSALAPVSRFDDRRSAGSA